MAMRLRAFCADQPELFENVKDFQQTLADLDAAIADLRTHVQAQDSGLASFHEAVRMRGVARTTLRRTLDAIRTFAATLGTVGLDEKFRLRRFLTDAALLVRARSFVADAAPIAEALVARGLPSMSLHELPNQIAALEGAIGVGTEQRRLHVGARAGIQAALTSATHIVKRLDAMVLHGPPRDAATVAGWTNIRRVGPAKAVEAPPAAPPTDQPRAAQPRGAAGIHQRFTNFCTRFPLPTSAV
jgi:hypothetical protein